MSEPAKLWAEGFNKQDSFRQIKILHNLYEHAESLTLKLQIVTLLEEKVQSYLQALWKAETQVKEQLGIIEKVKSLTCHSQSEHGLYCGLPKNHSFNPLTTRHQAGNVFWD